MILHAGVWINLNCLARLLRLPMFYWCDCREQTPCRLLLLHSVTRSLRLHFPREWDAWHGMRVALQSPARLNECSPASRSSCRTVRYPPAQRMRGNWEGPPRVLRKLKISAWFSDESKPCCFYTEAQCIPKWTVECQNPFYVSLASSSLRCRAFWRLFYEVVNV